MHKTIFSRYEKDSDFESKLSISSFDKKTIEPREYIKSEGFIVIQGDFPLGKTTCLQKLKQEAILWPDHGFDVSASSQIKEKKEDLLNAINTLQLCFDDLTERHIQYFRVKKELKKMRNTISSMHWDLLRVIIGCIDATTNTKTSDLNYSHVEAFKKVIQRIKVDMDCSTANSLLDILISSGLKPIPDLHNLEPIEI